MAVRRPEIIDRLSALGRARPLVLAAIDGPGGAGKSALAELLSSGLAASGILVQIVHFDRAYAAVICYYCR